MKKFLNIFFVVLGIIFFIIILIGIYLFVVDPWEIKPFIQSLRSTPTTTTEVNYEDIGGEPINGYVEDKNPLISDTQEKALEKIGIDPSSLPTEITPAMLTCFEGILGSERVAEIRSGDTPSAIEFFKVKICL